MPRIGAQARRRLLRDDLADGLLGRHGPGLLDHEPEYIDNVWWSLKTIFDAGLLEQDHRVSPYCPGAETTLSDHELARGYETVVDPSVFVACPVVGGDLATAVPRRATSRVDDHPVDVGLEHRRGRCTRGRVWVARTGEATFVVAEDLLAATLGDDAEVLDASPRTGSGRRALPKAIRTGGHPRRPLRDPGDFVTTSDGSGIVHLAPAFGADDLAVCRSTTCCR